MPIEVARYQHQATQAALLREVEDRVWDHLDSKFSIITYDTIVYELFRHPEEGMIWFEGLHREWLRANSEFVRETSSSVMYRVMIVPYPDAVSDYHRQALREFIILNLHMQLWNGVVCGVKFLDPRLYPPDLIAREFSVAAFPVARALVDFPGYHLSEHISKNTIAGLDYDHRLSKIEHWLFGIGSPPIWLFYDEEHFSGQKLQGWHWQQLRHFFVEIMRGSKCPECRAAEPTSLDHRGPFVAGKYPQTLPNLQLLCGSCNSSKGVAEPPNPTSPRYFRISDHLDNSEMNRLLRDPPLWLGKVSRPRRNYSKLFQVAGFS